MYTSCGELWIWHQTQPVYVHLMQTSLSQPTHRPHPRQHREFDESSKLVSPLWCEKLEGLYQKDSLPSEKIHGWRDFKIKSRMQRILDVVNFEFDTEPNPCMYIWMQRSFYQPTLVSFFWCEKLGGLYHKASHPLEKIHGFLKPNFCNKYSKHLGA